METLKRSIIKIDEAKCNGCGECIPNCPEGAMQLIDDKARLISDLFCDGLGACIGHCPQGAITIEKRVAEKYDESRVMENIVKQGENVIKAHLKHLKDHNQTEFYNEAINYLNKKKIGEPIEEKIPQKHTHPSKAEKHSGCPGAKVMEFSKPEGGVKTGTAPSGVSQLSQWPIQITLVPPTAPFLNNADLLIAADCVPFSYPNFHDDLLKGKILLIGCPKMDDVTYYESKLASMFKQSNIKSIEVVHMEVPCCFGLKTLVESAIEKSGKNIPYKSTVIGIKGERHG